MNANTLTKLTVRDGVNALDEALKSFVEGSPINETTKAIALEAILRNVQIRDYALGMVNGEQGLKFWEEFNAETSQNVALLCVYSGALYSVGNADKAMEQIERALDIEPTYTLTTLLRRVYRAEWSPKSMDDMRSELHPKVKSIIEKIADQPLREE